MLNRLFEDPSAKLQKLLKWLFVGSSCLGAISIFIYEIAKLIVYTKVHSVGMILLSLVALVLGPILFVIVNYIRYLFEYMLLNFFTDVHEIRKKSN